MIIKATPKTIATKTLENGFTSEQYLEALHVLLETMPEDSPLVGPSA